MESAEPQSSQQTAPTANDLVVEWSATIRGAMVSVRWHSGRLEGDREVLDRIAHLGPDQTLADSVEAARSIVNRVLLDPVEIVRLPNLSTPLPEPPDLAS
jgi:hypothetical protein